VSNPEVWGWDIVKAFRLRVVEDFLPFVSFLPFRRFVQRSYFINRGGVLTALEEGSTDAKPRKITEALLNVM
jgi:hypothetical protein